MLLESVVEGTGTQENTIQVPNLIDFFTFPQVMTAIIMYSFLLIRPEDKSPKKYDT